MGNDPRDPEPGLRRALLYSLLSGLPVGEAARAVGSLCDGSEAWADGNPGTASASGPGAGANAEALAMGAFFGILEGRGLFPAGPPGLGDAPGGPFPAPPIRRTPLAPKKK
ncbi:MAG: hypothetical protein LBF40_02610 [Deltaproteobacteria bacterium]|jgi:hypothetical protein|nr:hypothetical protein [Deltaproteobacteria bacterium]